LADAAKRYSRRRAHTLSTLGTINYFAKPTQVFCTQRDAATTQRLHIIAAVKLRDALELSEAAGFSN
jgi:hypothetical protein